MGTAAIYTGYKLYSHYKENHTPAPPIEVLPKESSKITQKPNLPRNNRPPVLGGSAALQQLAQAKSKDLQSNPNNRPASSALSAKWLKNQLIAEEISGGHAYTKHVIERKEFSGLVSNRMQLKELIEYVLNNPSETRSLSNNRTGYWDQNSGTVIIRDPLKVDGGTAFRPIKGKGYFDDVLR